MNLWFRLIWLALTAPWRGRIEPPFGVSQLSMRVWPTDLDLNGHMNNGRYLTVMDLGRLDLVMRSGLWRVVRANGWAPMMGAAVIRFRRELRPFASYRLETRIVAWTDTVGIMEHRFILPGGRGDGAVAARALVKAGFYDRRNRNFVPLVRLIEALGVDPGSAVSPPLPPDVEAFLAADKGLRPVGQAPHTPEGTATS